MNRIRPARLGSLRGSRTRRSPSRRPTLGWRSGYHHRGFSLLEIVLALAILGGSLAVLSQIAELGTTAALEARELAACRIQCQAKLSETLLDAAAGIAPQSVFDVPLASFDSNSIGAYTYTLEVRPAPLEGLLALRVSVQALSGAGEAPRATFTLHRWIVDPALQLSQAEADEEARKAELRGEGETL